MVGFAELADEVHDRETTLFDAPILSWLGAHRTVLLTRASLFFGVTGSSYMLGPVGLMIVLGPWRSRKRAAVFLALGMAGALGLNLAAKVLVGRLRPELFERLSITPGYAFPSGHAVVSTAFFLSLAFISWRRLPRYRWLAVVGVALTLSGGVSRSYLQVHYPSDVLAGWLLSGAWVPGLNSWFGRRSVRRSLHPAARPDGEVDKPPEQGGKEHRPDAKDRDGGGG